MKKKQIKIKRQKMNPGQTRDKREIIGMKKRQIILKMKPGMKEWYNRDKKQKCDKRETKKRQKWDKNEDRLETKKRQIGDKMKTKIHLKISP